MIYHIGRPRTVQVAASRLRQTYYTAVEMSDQGMHIVMVIPWSGEFRALTKHEQMRIVGG